MDAIRWGIIGCGAVTEKKSGPAFQKVEGSRLVAVMRRDGDLAKDYAQRHGVGKWYDDAEALVADPEVDAVYVATPPGTHLEHALLACAAKKPVYVEKPMARSHEECARMVAAFALSGVPLFVAYYRRALPRFLKAKELLAAGRLGRVTGVTSSFAQPFHREVDPLDLPWRVRAESSGGGLFLDLGSHTLDILDFLLGPLEHVTGSAANGASPYEVEDRVALQFRAAGGVLGTSHWNFASAVRADQIVIQGEAGELRFSTFGEGPLELREGGAPDHVERFDLPNPEHVEQPMIASVVRHLRGLGACESTGESGARTSAVMDAALTSYYGTRVGAFWTRSQDWPGRRAAARPGKE